MLKGVREKIEQNCANIACVEPFDSITRRTEDLVSESRLVTTHAPSGFTNQSFGRRRPRSDGASTIDRIATMQDVDTDLMI